MPPAVAQLCLVRRCYAPRVNESFLAIVSSIIYRQIHPSETAAVSSLAREVFDKFVAPHYQTEGVAEFHRYASVQALSQRHESGHVTLVAEHSGELVGMLHLRELCHVSMLFVQSFRQRGGIGRGLLAGCGSLENHGRNHGFPPTSAGPLAGPVTALRWTRYALVRDD